MTEYVNIMEAARRYGVSDKTIRRAIRADKLQARYPKPNQAEIATRDLEEWRQAKVRPRAQEETDQRLTEMERRLVQLERQVQQLLELQPAKRMAKPSMAGETPPEGFVWLHEFADRHFVSRNEANRLYQTGMIHGQKISISKRRAPIAIGPRGRRDFYTQFHQTPGFRSCDECGFSE